MADDSELDYIRTFLSYICINSEVKHYSEIRDINLIDNDRRMLVFPGELLTSNNFYYEKRYKIKISEPSEAALMDTFANLQYYTDELNRRITLGQYKGTESFDDDVTGTKGQSIVFQNNAWYDSGATAYTIIEDLEDGHRKVLHAYNHQNTSFQFSHSWDEAKITGTYEYWFKNSDVTDECIHDVYDAAASLAGIEFRVEADKIQYYYTGSWNDATGGGLLDDTWYHFKFTFNCTAQTYSFYLNEVLLDANIPFYQAPASLIHCFWGHESTVVDGDIYYDAFGFDWDSTYTVGDNFDAYSRPSILYNINIASGNKAYEVGANKRWNQDIYLDIMWYST